MDPMVTRRIPSWAIVGAILFVITASGFGLWLERQAIVDRQWSAVVQRTDALIADADARDYTRPILRGEPIPGNAWEHYQLAINELNAEDKFYNVYVNLLSDFNRRTEKSDRPAVEAILSKHGGTLDHIRRGVRCTMARFTYDWTQGWSTRTPDNAEQSLRLLSISAARNLQETGRHREAAELMLDMCLFGRDRAHNAHKPSTSYIAMLDELKAILVSGKLTQIEIAQVDRELAVLDLAAADPVVGHMNAILRMGMGLRREVREDRTLSHYQSSDNEPRAGTRDLYSRRLMDARAFHLMDHWTSQLAACEALPWLQAKRECTRLWPEIESEEALFQRFSSVLIGGSENRRWEIAWLRLLRIAAHYLATDEILELADPFGTGALKTRRGESLKIWSVWRDGLDQSGQGGWEGHLGPDLVLEVIR